MSLLDIPLLLPKLILMMNASNAAYEPSVMNRQKAMEALGFEWKGVTRRPDRDITVVKWVGDLAPPGGANLSITQGTCFTSNTNPREIIADIDVRRATTPYGRAPRGFWGTIPLIAPDVHAMGDPSLPWHHTGHSLGGQTAQGLIAEIPGTAWPINPPTGYSQEFWTKVLADPRNKVIPLVNEREFAHGWMVGWDWHQVFPFVWLHHGQLLESNGRDGVNIDESDHMGDATLTNLLAALVKPKAPALGDA